MATLGDLVVNLSANTTRLQQGLNRGQQSVKGFTSRATAVVQSGVDRMRAALGSIGGAFAGLSVIGATGGMIKLAADAETLSVQLEVLTGSADTASKVMSDVSEFAASTPFQKLEIGKAAKQLLAFNGSADNVVGELRMIGDLAAATGIPLGDLAEIYGKARVQGRLFGEDINQLTGRGIPIVTALAKQFGVAESEIKGMVSEGKIGFPELERAFKNMTSDGGKFAGMMERLSETTAGKFSTMKDNFVELGTQLGMQLLPAVNQLLEVLLQLAQSLDGLPMFIKRVRIAFADMSFDALVAKERVKGFFGDDFAALRIQAFEQQRRDAVNNILGLKPNDEKIVSGRQQEIEALNIGRNLGLAISGAIGGGSLVESFTDAAMKITQNDLPRGAIAPSQTESRLEFAGATEKGSVEAYSAILAAVSSRGSKSPEVVATEKQTKELIKNLKPEPMEPFHVVEVLT